ncbi:MAG: hypothetical protein M1504_00490 [Candidatus Marsarchaeota archaeon]|nr:hypothetical protein [Candidatus Marsarchaeota archaeon]
MKPITLIGAAIAVIIVIVALVVLGGYTSSYSNSSNGAAANQGASNQSGGSTSLQTTANAHGQNNTGTNTSVSSSSTQSTTTSANNQNCTANTQDHLISECVAALIAGYGYGNSTTIGSYTAFSAGFTNASDVQQSLFSQDYSGRNYTPYVVDNITGEWGLGYHNPIESTIVGESVFVLNSPNLAKALNNEVQYGYAFGVTNATTDGMTYSYTYFQSNSTSVGSLEIVGYKGDYVVDFKVTGPMSQSLGTVESEVASGLG